MIYIIKTPNALVVDHNFQILEDAAKKADSEVKILTEDNYLSNKYQKNSIVIAGCLEYAFKLLIRGHKNICSWVQGVSPEESYLRNGNPIKRFILSLIEKYALKRVKYFLFVSETMKIHYEKKYKIKISSYDVFPCFNTDINIDAFTNDKDKYDDNIFVYAGGCAKWQGLDKIVFAYSQIQDLIPKSKFLFLTNDSQKAAELVAKNNIKNFEINYVPKAELPKVLSKCKFGFVLREDNVVNNVSTPTKLSTYLSCGVIPVFSDSIHDFYNLMLTKKYKIVYNSLTFLEDVKSFSIVNPLDIMNEYKDIFSTYYSSGRYVNIISCALGKMRIGENQ